MWRGIIGKSFKTVADFSTYVDSVSFGLWRPRFIVVHNTSAPDLKTYENWQTRPRPVTDEQWMLNLQGYYRDQQGWSAGPHLFVTPKSICVFSPLNGPGTHTPSWNSISWGIETVGEFETDPFDDGVRDNLVGALAVLHMKAGLSPLPYEVGQHGLHFHKEDVHTTHKSCPGRHMVKDQLIRLVQAKIETLSGGEHSADKTVTAPAPAPSVATTRTGTVQVPTFETLNVRAAAGGKAPVVAKLQSGAKVTITGEAMNANTKWLSVDIPGDADGWVAAAYVKIA